MYLIILIGILLFALFILSFLIYGAVKASQSKRPLSPTQQVQNPYRRFYSVQDKKKDQNRRFR